MPHAPAACHARSAAYARCTRAARPVGCSFDAVGASPRRQHAISARARRNAICDGDARCRLMEAPCVVAPPSFSAACHALPAAWSPRHRRASGRSCPSGRLTARPDRLSPHPRRRQPHSTLTLESAQPPSRSFRAATPLPYPPCRWNSIPVLSTRCATRVVPTRHLVRARLVCIHAIYARARRYTPTATAVFVLGSRRHRAQRRLQASLLLAMRCQQHGHPPSPCQGWTVTA